MKKINIETWHRKQTYLFFKDFDYPKFSITVDLDISSFYKWVKKENVSFYFAMIYLVMKQMNQVEAFKYRIINQEVFLFDSVHPSFTDQIPGSDHFKIVNSPYHDDLKEFINQAKLKSISQGDLFINIDEETRHDFVYFTTFPWAKFTQVTHAYHHAKSDAIPRICFGKFIDIDNKKVMPFSIEVHHGVLDGLHVGRFIEHLQEQLLTYENQL